MRRADLLLSFGDKDEVDGHILARTANGVKGSEQRGLRTFLIDRAAAHDDFSEAGLVEQSGFEGRRRSEEHTSELQSRLHLVCRLLLEKKKKSSSPSRTNDDCSSTTCMSE